jgi:hypothetical protein
VGSESSWRVTPPVRRKAGVSGGTRGVGPPDGTRPHGPDRLLGLLACNRPRRAVEQGGRLRLHSEVRTLRRSEVEVDGRAVPPCRRKEANLVDSDPLQEARHSEDQEVVAIGLRRPKVSDDFVECWVGLELLYGVGYVCQREQVGDLAPRLTSGNHRWGELRMLDEDCEGMTIGHPRSCSDVALVPGKYIG